MRSKRTNQHLSIEQLEGLLAGTMAPEAAARLHNHLHTCAYCRERLTQEQAWIMQIRGEERPRWANQPLTPQESSDIQQRLYRRIRRALIMQNIRLSVQGAVTLVLFVVLVGVLAFWLRGNSQTADPEATPTTELTLDNLATDDNPAVLRLAVMSHWQDEYRALIRAYEEDNPSIRVEIVVIDRLLDIPVPSVEGQRQVAMNADVIAWETTPETVQEGLRLDLTPFIQSENFNQDDFYPGLLEQFQWQGGTWAIPVTAQFEVVAYNRDLFDRAGLPYPEVDWTWADFLVTAQSLTLRSETGEVTQWGYVDDYLGWASSPPNLAGPLVEPGSDPPQPRLSDPAVVAAVQFYGNLFQLYEVAPILSGDEASSGSGRNLINGNRAAMWRENATLVMPAPYGTNWSAVPFPEQSPMTAEGLAISAGTQQAGAAWHLLSYLSRQLLWDDSARSPQGHPARQSVTQATGFYNLIEPEMADTLRQALEQAEPRSLLPGSADARRALIQAWPEILSGRQDAPSALALAQAQAEAYIANEPVPAVAETDFVVAPGTDLELSAGEGELVITYAPVGGGLAREAVFDLADDFMAANAGLIINLEPYPLTETNNLAGIAAAADCFEWRWPFDSQAMSEAALSLEPFMDADPSINKEDFFPVLVSQFSRDGELLGLPGETSLDIIGYNKDLFDAAGLPYPTPDWTVEQFLDTAIALTQGEGADKQYGYLPHPFEGIDFVSWMLALAPDLIDESVTPARLRLDDPATIEAVRWHTSLTAEYGLKPLLLGPDSAGMDDWWAIRDSHQAGMWLEPTFVNASERFHNLPENTGYVPIPAAADGSWYSNGGGFQVARGYFIAAGAAAEPRQACWQWITFLSQQFFGTSDIGVIPAHRTVVETAYRPTFGDERTDMYLAYLESLEPPRTNYHAWLQIYHWLPQVYDQILLDDVPVEQALAQAQSQFNAYRDCLVGNDAFGDSVVQQACLVSASP